MPDLILGPAEQSAMRSLLAAEPVPGTPLPTTDVILRIAELMPCDAIGVVLVDNTGFQVDQVSLPWEEPVQDHLDGGPFYIGIMHWSRFPRHAAACGVDVGAGDAVAIGFRNGPDHVVQLWMGRGRGRFSERDIALLSLLSPVLGRLMRERPTPRLPANLTVQERRVLMHVAAGRSNQEIAEGLFIAPNTVRKHLEHIYRKLGVTNRLAAVAALQGRDLPNLDLKERIDRYA